VPEVTEVHLAVIDERNNRLAELRIGTLPSNPRGLWDDRAALSGDTSVEPIQLLEGQEYRYTFLLEPNARVPLETDHADVFVADTTDGLTGRVRPGLFTGLLSVRVTTADRRAGEFRLEVRSHKLDYLRDYRWMLRDIAGTISELVMRQFAPSQQRFTPDASRDPATLYQRFAFLKATLADESFVASIHHILARPHVSWEQEEHTRRPGQGWPGGSLAVRQLARGGRRTAAPALTGILGEVGVPERLLLLRAEPQVDNVPNRFVKFALMRWLELVDAVSERLPGSSGSAAMRGWRDVAELRDQLDSWMAEELFREVGDLKQFPSNDQVLQKREGYRDIFQTYVLCEVASQLSWQGGDDVYGAGQKDVATLYEYWAFLQLASVVASLSSVPFDWSSLLSVSRDGMSVDLKRGKEIRLRGSINRLGRTLELDLWFNRTFGSRTGADTSWSRPMRPDCSLFIKPTGEGSELAEPVWLHFDAKYRVDSVLEIMTPLVLDDSQELAIVEEEDEAELVGKVKRDDLLKMHAYRDAIRRSAGAYVLYPGTARELREEYHEILPGLGAFALKPSETGDAIGTGKLKDFVLDVADHMASQLSQHERGRFWNKKSFERPSVSRPGVRAAQFLAKPPADARVLLGFVRSDAHLDWIHRTRRYNLRADDRTGSVGLRSEALAAEIVVLYLANNDLAEIWATGGPPELFTWDRMLELGYPRKPGWGYLCLPLERDLTSEWMDTLSTARVLAVRRALAPAAAWGEPVCVSWLELQR
jgi:predicted component of viral defense system (DUF524 family)